MSICFPSPYYFGRNHTKSANRCEEEEHCLAFINTMRLSIAHWGGAVNMDSMKKVGFEDVVRAYLREDWPLATALTWQYLFEGEAPERLVLLAVGGLTSEERARLEKVLSSWDVGKEVLYAVLPEGKRQLVWLTRGLDLAQVGRLVERKSLPFAVYAGPETEGSLVKLNRGASPEPLLPYTLENILLAFSRALGQEVAGMYLPARGFMRGMIEVAERKRMDT